MPRRGERPPCPKCGMGYNYIERVKRGGNVYCYAVHRLGKEKRKCYLGPERYIYVSRTHAKEGLTFAGPQVEKRALLYLEKLANYLLAVADMELSPSECEELGKILGELSRKFYLLARSLATNP